MARMILLTRREQHEDYSSESQNLFFEGFMLTNYSRQGEDSESCAVQVQTTREQLFV